MDIDEIAVGPNRSSDADDFFQSDRDLEVRRARQERTNFTRGRPVQLKGKVLALTLADNEPSKGSAVYAGTSGFVVTRIDLASKKVTASYSGGHKGPVTSVAVVDAKQIVSGSWDKTAILWDVESKKPLRQFSGHSDFVKSVACSSDGTTFYTGSSDFNVRKWDVRMGQSVQTLKGHTRPVEYVALYGEQVFSASSDSTIRRWDLAAAEPDLVLKGHSTTVFSLHFAPEMDAVFSTSADKTVRRWDLQTGSEEGVYEHSDWVKAACIRGSLLVTAGRDETVTVWDLQTDQIRRQITGHFDEVTSMALIGGTNKILSGSLDCTIRFWDLDGE